MPTKTLRITVKENLDLEGVEAALNEHLEELETFIMEETLLPDRLRGTYCDDSFEIESVENGLKPNEYFFSYSFGWSAHYGCKGMNTGDTEYCHDSFKYIGNEFIFEIEEKPEERDPDEP